jgi:hypothetical protein
MRAREAQMCNMNDDDLPPTLAIQLGPDRLAIIAKLYLDAPPGDDLSRRKWAARQLGIDLRTFNRLLWAANVKWEKVPSRAGRRKSAVRDPVALIVNRPGR